MNAQLAFADGDFGDFRRVTSQVIHDCHALKAAGRWLAPVRFLRGKIQNGQQSRRLRQQAPAHFQRVLLACRSQLIQKRLGKKCVLRITDRAPERRRNGAVGFLIIHVKMREGVFQRIDAFHRDAVYTVAGPEKRRTHHARAINKRPAIGVQRSGEGDVSSRTERSMLDIVFARPCQFDGNTRDFGNLHSFFDVVGAAAPPESSAHEHAMDGDLIGLKTGYFRCHLARAAGHLSRRPDFAFVALESHCTVQRFHARMRQIRSFINRLQLAPGLSEYGCVVTVVLGDRAWLCGQLDHLLPDNSAAKPGVRTFVPLDLQCLAALHSRPGVVGENSYAARNDDNVSHSRNRPGLRRIHAGYFATKDRTTSQHCVRHAWNMRVNPELGGSAYFVARIKTFGWSANQFEAFGVFLRCVLRNRQLRRNLGERSISGPLTWADDEAVLGSKLRRIDVPLLRRCLDKHQPRSGSRSPHRLPHGANAGAAIHALHGSERCRIDWSKFGAHSGPIAIKLIGQNHRQ